ncbi:MAG: class I SAM-dependent methyltransferase [Candidatus Puniceispirillales bacterium]
MLETKKKERPTNWIIEQIKLIAPKRKIQILDFASGNGRNSIHLAEKDKIIAAIDKDSKRLDEYRKFNYINTICFDLETDEEWPLKKDYFDIIIVVNYLYRPRIKNLISLLKTGGYLFYETFALGNEKYGSPKNPDYLLKDKELLNLFSKENEILSYFNGMVTEEKISIKQRCVIKKTS